MEDQQDLGAVARGILDANLYMTLATVDPDGRPWATPVFYAAAGYSELYWMSSPEVAHSRNLAQQPLVSIVVFDSRLPAGTGQAVYMAASAEELAGADLERGVELYPGPARRGGRPVTPEELRPPAAYRLYRATVSRHWVLCPRTARPCDLHGHAYDHRTEVSL